MTTAYDEFSMFRDNAEEVGLFYDGPPAVSRVGVPLPDGRSLSALVWGTGDPEIVLIHGGAQNAHTWDTVALALARPLVAVDLPGHGHSDWRDDHRYSPRANADDVAAAVEQLAPSARLVVGMSLGGMTAICLAARHPKLVPRLVVVDVTPGTDHAKAEPIIAFIDGPERFESFDEILERTVQFNPTRSVSSLRRGVLHNAAEQPDGSWSWRYDRFRPENLNDEGEARPVDFANMWDDVSAITAPMMLVRGGLSGVVGDEDVAELKRRQPAADVVVVEGAGHSIQGDKPVELAQLLSDFLSK
jgi:pimeloyl-ACP methyl ester carboxylesterase